MRKIKLGVNIDHVATLRNARNENSPNLLDVSKVLKELRVDSITVHLREDRRHIKDGDVVALKEKNFLPLNLEMAATKEMKDFCLKILPESCCIVPERREELTTEGGLNVKNQMDYLGSFLPELLKKTKISLFIDPDFDQIYASKELGAHAVELHTGKYANLFREKKQHTELERIKKAAKLCSDIGLDCHAGHGLNFENVKDISLIDEILELNVGHFLISHSLYTGLKDTILKFMKIINHPKSK